MNLNFSNDEDDEVMDNVSEDEMNDTYPDGYENVDAMADEGSDEADESYDDAVYDYSKMQKLKKTAIIVGSSIIGLVLLSLILTFSVISKQTTQEKNIKDWVKDYLAEAYSDELTDEQLDQIAEETGFLLTDALGADDLDFTTLTDEQISEIVSKIRQPLMSNLSDEEATELSETLISKYYEKLAEEGGTIPGQTDSATIEEIQAKLNDLEYNDTQLASSVKTVASQAGKTTQGAQGVQGPQGIQGIQGTAGKDGTNGTNGVDGKDGTNGTNGVDGKDGTNGKDGADGKDGTNGADGTSSYTFYSTSSTASSGSLTIPDADEVYCQTVQATSQSEATTKISSSAWVLFKKDAVEKNYDETTNTLTLF